MLPFKHDLVQKVKKVRQRSTSNSSEILVWRIGRSCVLEHIHWMGVGMELCRNIYIGWVLAWSCVLKHIHWMGVGMELCVGTYTLEGLLAWSCAGTYTLDGCWHGVV